jgi:hypothetical protein
MTTNHTDHHTAEVWVVITLDPETGAITDTEVLSQPPAWDLAALGQVCRTGYVNGGDSVWYTQQRHTCAWCGETEPLVDSDTRESYPVEVTEDGAYHAPCLKTYATEQRHYRQRVRAADYAAQVAREQGHPHRETYPHP